MDKYRRLCYLGRGSYGQVIKCKNEDTGRVVAIKKIFDSDKDSSVKKIALREIRMLKKLKHNNLVSLIEVFQHRNKICLVFEFVEATLEDELAKYPDGLAEFNVKKIMWQVLKAVEFFHDNGIIHRDLKPDNILLSKDGIVKICDLGFARPLDNRLGACYTDYVATRWYRAPELLVGDTKYGSGVDIWAIGCIFGELISGQAMFSGSSDLDQLSLIVRSLGNLSEKLRAVFVTNEGFKGVQVPRSVSKNNFDNKFKNSVSQDAVNFTKACLIINADERSTCKELMKKSFFTAGEFSETFNNQLNETFDMINGVNKHKQVKRSTKRTVRKTQESSQSKLEPESSNIEPFTSNEFISNIPINTEIEKLPNHNQHNKYDVNTTQSLKLPGQHFENYYMSQSQRNSLVEQRKLMAETRKLLNQETIQYPYISGVKVPLLHPADTNNTANELFLPTVPVNIHYHFYSKKNNNQYQQQNNNQYQQQHHNQYQQQNNQNLEKKTNLPNIFANQ